VNILVLHNFETEEQDGELLFEHLREWSKTSANIWIVSKKILHNKYKQSNIKYKKLPPYIPFWLSFYVWYYTTNHPNFDVLIDGSKNFTFSIQNIARIKTVYYFSGKRIKFVNLLKKYKLKFLLKYIFKSNYFLFTNKQTSEEAGKLFGFVNIHFLVIKAVHEKIRKVKLAKTKDFFNLVFINFNGNPDSNNKIIKVFEEIARKNEGWNLFIFDESVRKNNAIPGNALNEYSDQIYIEKHNNNFSFLSKIPTNSIVLDISEAGLPLNYLQTFAANSVPFISKHKNTTLQQIKNFNKLVYTSGDINELTAQLLSLGKDEGNLEKVIAAENNWALEINNSKDVYSESLTFVETI
jgi:hypothetical protein